MPLEAPLHRQYKLFQYALILNNAYHSSGGSQKIVTAPSRFRPFEWASNGNSLSGNSVVSFQGEG